MHDTKLALRRWNGRPVRTLWPWVGLSLLNSLGLLASVYLMAQVSTPDSTRYPIPGFSEPAVLRDYLDVLFRNSLVLALHAMACVGRSWSPFLSLAAWMIAGRNGDWQELLAATFVTVAVAVPVILAAAAVEIWVSPHLLAAIAS